LRRRTRSRRKICPAKSRRGEKTPTAQTKLKTKTPARFAGRVRAFLRQFLLLSGARGSAEPFMQIVERFFGQKQKISKKDRLFC